MSSLQVGGIDVAQLREWDGDLFTREQVFPQSPREHWEANQDWLVPDYWDPAREMPWFVSQTYAFTSGGLKVLVDTGIGNDKDRGLPQWNHLDTDFLQKLTNAGYSPDSVDLVISTHLHNDHVGWNTRWDGDRWVPTFPNARYVFHRIDLDHLEALLPEQDPFGNRGALHDSVKPVIEAGLVEPWEGDSHRINGELELLRTPGHSAGSSVLVLENGGEVAILSGDIVHHPIQIVQPETFNILDGDPGTALASRRRILDLAADRDAVVLPAHFPGARGARVIPDGGGYKIREWVPFV